MATEDLSLHEAAFSDNVAAIEEIIRERPSLAHRLDTHGNTPLHVAVIARSRLALQALLDAGVVSAEVKNARKWTALDESIAIKDYEMVKIILT